MLFRSPQGPAGPGITFGTGAPQGTAAPGATYIDMATGDAYSYAETL